MVPGLLIGCVPVFALDNETPTLPIQPFDYASSFITPEFMSSFDTLSADQSISNESATLGRVLFFDRTLSKNGLVRCASCHSQSEGFDDPNRFSIGFEGKITKRNSMGLANARYNWNNRYFWDERVETLEHQVLQPIFDPVEMGMTSELLRERLSEKEYYRPLFTAAFGSEAITDQRIAIALAQFVRSMVSNNSRFDQQRSNGFTVGDPFTGFSAPENRGKFLFFTSIESGGSGCAQCHETDLFLMKTPTNNGVDSMGGEKARKFRAASLKNIAVRAPYMHDGRFKTLREVMDHYSGGIKPLTGLDERLVDKNGNARVLIKSDKDKSALIAFLKTLTDHQFLRDERFSDPFAN